MINGLNFFVCANIQMLIKLYEYDASINKYSY